MIRFDVLEPDETIYYEKPLELREEHTFQSIEDLLYYLILHRGIDFAKVAQMYVSYLESKDTAHRIENAESTMVAIYASGNGPNDNITNDAKQDLAGRWLVNFGNIPITFRESLNERLEKRNVNIDGTMGFGDLYKG